MTDNPNIFQGQLGDQRPDDVAISPDGSTIYAAGADGNLYAYSAATGQLLHTWDVGTQLGGMDISTDGSFAIVTELQPIATYPGPGPYDYPTFEVTVHKVDLTTGTVTNFDCHTTGFDYSFYDAKILSNGEVLLTESGYGGYESGGGTMKLLDLATGQYSDTSDGALADSVLTGSESQLLVGFPGQSDAPLEIYATGTGVTAVHDWYEDGVQGFNEGVQAFNEQAGLVAQGYTYGINIYDSQLHYEFNLANLHPELFSGGIAGLAFDQSGQNLYILNDHDDAIYQVSTSDWSIVGEIPVGGDIATGDGDFGNRLLISPDGSYFTVVTETGLVMVDPTSPPPPTDEANTLIGTSNADTIDGLGGNDIIKGLAGDDTLHGSAGDDVVAGGAGADTVDGGDGNDTLYSGDVVQPTIDYPYQPPALDHGTEVDTLTGGDGNDVIYAGYGDNVDGGNGHDTLNISFAGASSGITFDASLSTQVIGGGTITGIEVYGVIEGSNFADTIKAGNSSATYGDFTQIYGLGGNDTIVAGTYTTFIDGGDGNDTIDGTGASYLSEIDGGSGDDVIYTPEYGFTYVYGGDGNDTIYANWETHGGAGDDTIIVTNNGVPGLVTGDDGNDTITGGDGSDHMSGGSGADILTGGGGDDVLLSADGDPNSPSQVTPDMGTEHDVLSGGDGNDWLSIGYGDDADGGAGTDRLQLSLGGAPAGVTIDTSTLTSGSPVTIGGGTIQNMEELTYLRGSEFSDHLTVAAQPTAITVDGGGGDDFITVNGGDNVLIYGGDGNDRVDVYGGTVTVDGGNGSDEIWAEGGHLTAFGGAGDDTFVSAGNGNVFYGNDGSDTVAYFLATAGVTANLSTGVFPGGDQISEVENIAGSNFNDSLTGDAGANQLEGFAGNDTLTGGAGNDILDGGTGDDKMSGGLGNDTYYVDSSRDTVTELAGQGTDTVHSTITYTLGSNVENGVLDGTSAINLTGNTLDNHLTGNSAANTLNGGAGNDVLDGQGGADTMIGGAGNDTYIVDNPGDIVTEALNGGTDEVDALVSYALSSTTQVEKMVAIGPNAMNLTGNSLAQTIQGNAFDNVLTGLGGNDTLYGGDGNDTLIGGTGNDILSGGAGSDLFLFSLGDGKDAILDFSSDDHVKISGFTAAQSVSQVGSNVVVTLSSSDQITFDNSDVATVQAGLEFDTGGGGGGGGTGQTITGTSGNDVLNGTSGDDTISGLGGNDTIDGKAGNDTMIGGVGNDTYYVDSTGDVVTELAGQGTDTVHSTISYTLGANVENGFLDGTAAIDLTGNGLANQLHGNDGDNFLYGGAGNDTLIGGVGNDVLRGGLGADTLTGGAGSDIFQFEANNGNDKVTDFVSGTDKLDFHLLGITSADVTASLSNGNTLLRIDANHDGRADFTITLVGVTHVAAADYIFS